MFYFLKYNFSAYKNTSYFSGMMGIEYKLNVKVNVFTKYL